MQKRVTQFLTKGDDRIMLKQKTLALSLWIGLCLLANSMNLLAMEAIAKDGHKEEESQLPHCLIRMNDGNTFLVAKEKLRMLGTLNNLLDDLGHDLADKVAVDLKMSSQQWKLFRPLLDLAFIIRKIDESIESTDDSSQLVLTKKVHLKKLYVQSSQTLSSELCEELVKIADFYDLKYIFHILTGLVIEAEVRTINYELNNEFRGSKIPENWKSRIPVNFALSSADESSIEFLGEYVLLYACLHGLSSLSEKLIETIGVPTDYELKPSDLREEWKQDCGKNSPLHFACWRLGNVDLIAYLVERAGANIDSQDTFGRTPLHIACMQKDINLVRKLEELGADIHATSKNKETALHYAARSGELEVVLLLLEKEIDPRLKMNGGVTALHIAAQRGFLDCVTLLAERTGTIDDLTDRNETPLFLACSRGHIDVVKYLLSCNKEGDAVALATSPLLQKPNSGGLYPLHIACLRGHGMLVRFLIDEAGVDPHMLSKFSQFKHLIAPANLYGRLAAHGHTGGYLAKQINMGSYYLDEKNEKWDEPYPVRVYGYATPLSCEYPTNGQASPLYFACLSGNEEIAHYLLTQHHADISIGIKTVRIEYPNKVLQEALTIAPIHAAFFRHDRKLIETLLRHGSPPHGESYVFLEDEGDLFDY